jgi:hypothetical protein
MMPKIARNIKNIPRKPTWSNTTANKPKNKMKLHMQQKGTRIGFSNALGSIWELSGYEFKSNPLGLFFFFFWQRHLTLYASKITRNHINGATRHQ